MPVPTVYIERDPLLHMLAAAVESYNRECLGYLFGCGPNARRSEFRITSAFNCSGIVRRTNTRIHQSVRAFRRLGRFMEAAPRLYPYRGDFHSHPSQGARRRPFGPGPGDGDDMEGDDFGIIIMISRRRKKRLEWKITAKRTRLRGTLGGFDLCVTAYRLLKGPDGAFLRDSLGKRLYESLQVRISRSALQALNRTASRPRT